MILAGADGPPSQLSGPGDSSGRHLKHRLPLSIAKAQLTLWSLVAAPLFLSADLRDDKTVSKEYREIMLNSEMIKVD